MSELPAEITSYKGRLCEKHSDFIWGDYIDDSIVEGLYHFWHKQDIIAFHDGMVFNDGDTYVDKDFKDSVDLHIPVSLAIKPIQDYTHALQGVLNKYTERFPFSNSLVSLLLTQCRCNGIHWRWIQAVAYRESKLSTR